MKVYKKGQRLISMTNDQGLECGEIYTFIGEEIFNLPYMECSSHETKFLKVLDSSGKTHIITEKHGLFHDSRDTWSPEARAAALEARRRKARMRAKTPKEIESAPVKKESLSDTQAIYGLSEDKIKSLQKYSDFLDKDMYDFSLEEKDFLPGGKYERVTMEFLGVEGKEKLKEYLKEDPGAVHQLMDSEEEDLRNAANKINVENNLYNDLKDDQPFSNWSEYDCRAAIRDMIHVWAKTSGDSSKDAIASQIAANKEFSINGQLSHFGSIGEEMIQAEKNLVRPSYWKTRRKFLRSQYESTQKYLKEVGVKELILFRGYKSEKGTENELKSGHSVDVELQPLSSFSTSLSVAANFALSEASSYNVPSLIAVKVKADRILSVPKTGYGCTGENEVVVLGGKINASVYSGIDKVREIQSNCANVSDLLSKVSI